jgi:hypothetical protein
MRYLSGKLEKSFEYLPILESNGSGGTKPCFQELRAHRADKRRILGTATFYIFYQMLIQLDFNKNLGFFRKLQSLIILYLQSSR